MTGHALALRWIMYHSSLSAAHGDKIIIGASSFAQASQNLDIFEQGPLEKETVAQIEGIWEVVKDVSPVYHR